MSTAETVCPRCQWLIRPYVLHTGADVAPTNFQKCPACGYEWTADGGYVRPREKVRTQSLQTRRKDSRGCGGCSQEAWKTNNQR